MATLEYQRNWRAENRDHVREYHRKWALDHPESVKKHAAKKKEKRRVRRDRFVESQGKVCAICKTDDPGSVVGWHLDHDHSCCDTVIQNSCGACDRGVLCYRCNLKIVPVVEMFKDNPDLLRRTVEYLSLQPEDLGIQNCNGLGTIQC